MPPPNYKLSRRELISRVAAFGAYCALAPTATALAASSSTMMSTRSKSNRCEISLARFMMKADYPRLEVIGPAYRFLWHGRFFNFRIVSTAVDRYDERLSYVNFGPFEVGGVDLICDHLWPSLKLADGQLTGVGPGRVLLHNEENAASKGTHRITLEHTGAGRSLRLQMAFQDESSAISMTFIPVGFEGQENLFLSWNGNFIYDQMHQGEASAAYYSRGAQTGLRVSGSAAGSVTVAEAGANKTVTCRIPAGKPSHWTFEILRKGARLDKASEKHEPASSVSLLEPRLKPTAELPSWEAGEMSRRGWKAESGKVKERVAGLLIMATDWPSGVTWMPETHMDTIAKTVLPRIVESRAFGAVGLSRDGVTEKKENPAWFALVAQARAAGLRVYMKPGDGELTRMKDRSRIEAWAKTCFDVPEEHRCDVIRMPWEAVVVPWVTANLCLSPRFHTPELSKLAGLSWPRARERIVTSVADRFSFIIDSIRRYAPRTTIDLESTEPAVLEKLQSRHDRLGLMYMMYGQYPRVTEYFDLFYCAARKQAVVPRVVLESDCYYTSNIAGADQMRGKSFEELYPDEEIDLMQKKHRHLCNLPADAAWAFGVNIAFTEKKFRAVCEAANA